MTGLINASQASKHELASLGFESQSEFEKRKEKLNANLADLILRMLVAAAGAKTDIKNVFDWNTYFAAKYNKAIGQAISDDLADLVAKKSMRADVKQHTPLIPDLANIVIGYAWQPGVDSTQQPPASAAATSASASKSDSKYIGQNLAS